MDHQLESKRLFRQTLYFFVCVCYNTLHSAGVAELADASDLGSDALRCAGSIPVTRTKTKNQAPLLFTEM